MTDFEKKILIRDLKQNLADTDYVVIKAYEATLQGLPITQATLDIIQQRKIWRLELNELEAN